MYMKNIVFLVIVIITVALAVSCNIQNNADDKGSKETVSQQQEKGSSETPKMFQKVIPRDNDDILKRLDTMEETLNQRIDGIEVTVDNTLVVQKLDELRNVLTKSQNDIIKSVATHEEMYKKQLNQILAAILASMAALLLVMVLVYRYLKKFIAESVIISSHKMSASAVQPPAQSENEGENPVLKAVNASAEALNKKIAEAGYLFDPEKAVKLDSTQKAALTSINAESAFLKKAGCELTSSHDYLAALEKVNEKNYSEATQILEQAKKEDDNFSPVFFLAGYIAYVSRKYDISAENLAKACALEPENAAYLISYGNACLKEKKYKDAAESLKKAVELRPDDASVWNNLAHAYIVQDKTEEAVEAFGKAAELKPDFHEALHNLGLALGKLKKYEEALSAFEKAVAAKDDKHESMYNAACVSALLGKRDGALTNLKNAIALQQEYAAKAKKDKDFSSFKDDEEFKKIIS